MNRMTSVLALGLFLGLAPSGAYAQTDQQPAAPQAQEPAQTDTQMQEPAQTDTEQQVQQPAEGDTQQAQEPAEMDTQQAQEPAEMDTQQAQEPAETDTQQAQEPAETDQQQVEQAPATVEEAVIAAQEQDTWLASNLMGATVYSPDDEKIGDISDLIIQQDGMVSGVVIGVGGFLGIGEHKVALDLRSFSMQPQENGEPKLVLNATREEIEAAPEFKTAEQLKAEEEAQQQTPATPPAGSPATPPAPAD